MGRYSIRIFPHFLLHFWKNLLRSSYCPFPHLNCNKHYFSLHCILAERLFHEATVGYELLQLAKLLSFRFIMLGYFWPSQLFKLLVTLMRHIEFSVDFKKTKKYSMYSIGDPVRLLDITYYCIITVTVNFNSDYMH